jgi:hypothetical protein
LQITVTDVDESHPQFGTDETYILNVGDSGTAALVAATICGAMRGLQSFFQLVM